MASYLVDTCRGCLSSERASMMYSLCEEDTRRLFSNCTRLKITDDGTSLGQLCAQCYEFCETWFAFKSKCWLNDQGTTPPDKLDEDVPFETRSEDEDNLCDEENIESADEFDDETGNSSPSIASNDSRNSGKDRKSTYAPNESRSVLNFEWKCVYCHKEHASYDELRDHMKGHFKNNLCCRLCELKFSRYSRLTAHVVQVHMKKWDCPRCSLRLCSFLEFDTHMEVEHQERGYGYLGPGGEAHLDEDWNCPVCNQQFNQYRTLRTHLREHIKSSKNKFHCPLCTTYRSEACALYPHILKDHMRKFDCKLCPAKYESLVCLNNHLLKCHQENDTNKQIAVKKERMRIWSAGEYSGEDTESEEFYQPPAKKIRTEMVIKTEPGSSKKGRNVAAVATAKLIPNGNWDCLACKKKFYNFSSLRDHLRSVHISEKKRKCPICGHFGSTAGHTIVHLVRQHMGKFSCPACPRILNSFPAFNNHVENEHGISGYDEEISFLSGQPI